MLQVKCSQAGVLQVCPGHALVLAHVGGPVFAACLVLLVSAGSTPHENSPPSELPCKYLIP